MGELFAEGTFVGSSGVLRGAAEVERMLHESVIVYEDGTPRTKHVTTNVALELSGSTASGRAYFTVLQAVPGFPLQTIAAGRCDDRFMRGAGGWRSTERRARVDLVGDSSRHLCSRS
ncbi:nuclear transport factor 2 family protein [Amycolatopsis mediterranei]|nr:nuclear transport factor 2 family protein [Amycolatopsis mediterranei]